MDQILAIIVLAAGQGTRMKSATPKLLHPLAASSACAVRSTCATIGDPASGCRSFGVADFMRVPWPAASTMMASF